MGFFSRLFSRFFTSKKEESKLIKRKIITEYLQHKSDVINSEIARLNHKKLEIWESAQKAAIEGRKVDALLFLQHYRSLEFQIYQSEKKKEEICKLQQNEDLDNMAVYHDLYAEYFAENKLIEMCYCTVIPANDERCDDNDPDVNVPDDIVPDVDSLYQKLMKEIAQDQGDSETDEDASDKTESSPNEVEDN